ncbi:MAG: type I restriction-modification system subunit M [Acidobacteriota bacterium]|nr:type I restriction-modification system subunit M [Acidobacteriota bacterium]
MLTDSKLRSQVNAIWNKLHSGGLPNPLDSIEQLSYLLFLKRIDDEEKQREQNARLRGQEFTPLFADSELRWGFWTNLPAAEALKHVKEKVFPALKMIGSGESSFAIQMENAEFKINKANLLIEVCKEIDAMQVSQQNQDVQGDIYEFLLGKLGDQTGRNGQFRTPRHVIRMMVQMIEPKVNERICDPAAGTCGFLVNAYQYILEKNTSREILTYDEEGMPHNLAGDLLDERSEEFLQTEALTGFDSDSGMTMLRIGSMNLMLHGIKHPRFFYNDTLSKTYTEERRYDVVLANPPFKGSIDASSIGEDLPASVKKTELLFQHLFLRILEMGGRCGVIVPDGVLFGSSNAHVSVRKKLIDENRLEAVVSMPSGVFKPYAGVSTAVLIFTKGGATDKIWFYDMTNDGFSLDDKRQKQADNDIPDILECWRNRKNEEFYQMRDRRLAELKTAVAPMKAQRLNLQRDINRLMFESVIAPADDETARITLETEEQILAELAERIQPIQKEIDQLGNQFWVTKKDVQAHKYDLSASRYRQIEADETFYEEPNVTLERLMTLEDITKTETNEILQSVNLILSESKTA